MTAEGRCLIVEDDEVLARSLGRLMGPQVTTVVARTSADAKRQLEDGRAWRALFIDVRLPDGSGLEVLAHARSAHPLTPAMVLTGYVDPAVVNAAYDLNAICVAKPVVVDRIRRFLQDGEGAAGQADGVIDAWVTRHGLTRAEGEVMRMSLLGDSKRAVAERRGSSEQTVKKQLANALRKTGDASLLAAAQRLLREALRIG